jgi:hypothetical protein
VRVLAEPFPATATRPGDPPFGNGRVTFGQPVDICFNGYGHGPISVSVSGPSGFKTSGVLHRLAVQDCGGSECAAYDWIPAIDDSWPVGRYTVVGRSGPVHAKATFSVITPTETGLRILGPSTDPGHNEIAADSTAELFLVGFRHTRSVRLVVYRLSQPASGSALFFSTASVPIPASGNTTVYLSTGHLTSETTFVVTTRSGNVTLFAPLNITPPSSDANTPLSDASLVVGALPTG